MRRSLPPLLACAIILGLCVTAHAADLPAVKLDDKEKAQQGSDIAWMLVATGLVLVMVPGLALFYGGMVRRKNALGTMMHSMIALSVVGIQWVLFGYSLAFGATVGGWFGWSPEFLALKDPSLYDKVFPGTRLPIAVHCMWALGFGTQNARVVAHSVVGCAFYGAYGAKMLGLRMRGLPSWALSDSMQK